MPLAPKKLHFIWVGTPIPEKYVKNIKKWRKKNPDYEVYLWTDSGSVTPSLVAKAQENAASTGVKIMDLQGNMKQFLTDPNVTNGRLYNDEVSGNHANYAAASDILRLEILSHPDFGGVYIDTDILPNKTSLGDIELPHGYARPMNFYNDAMCAIPGAPLLKEFKDELKILYEKFHTTGSDVSINERVDMHRSGRPWKDRTATTLDLSGMGPILPVIQRHINRILKDQGLPAAEKFSHEITQKELLDKFISQSDQTWIDKGPQNVEQENIYFKEEFKFRLKHSFNLALEKIIAQIHPTEVIEKAIKELEEKILMAPDQIRISEIVREFTNNFKKSKQTNKTVLELTSTVDEIETLLSQLTIHDKNEATKFKSLFFPSRRFIRDTTLDTALQSSLDLTECRDKLKSILANENDIDSAEDSTPLLKNNLRKKDKK